MYAGKGTKDSLVAYGDASSWATLRQYARLMKEWACTEHRELLPQDAQPRRKQREDWRCANTGQRRAPLAGRTRAPGNLLLERYEAQGATQTLR